MCKLLVERKDGHARYDSTLSRAAYSIFLFSHIYKGDACTEWSYTQITEAFGIPCSTVRRMASTELEKDMYSEQQLTPTIDGSYTKK